jgi:cytochrome c oxidase assembly protein Cox11
MPVLFHIDKHLPQKMTTLTLAYTLFDATGLKKIPMRSQAIGHL